MRKPILYEDLGVPVALGIVVMGTITFVGWLGQKLGWWWIAG